jgi:hypothetical protein
MKKNKIALEIIMWLVWGAAVVAGFVAAMQERDVAMWRMCMAVQLPYSAYLALNSGTRFLAMSAITGVVLVLLSIQGGAVL